MSTCENCEVGEVSRYTDDDVGLCGECYRVLFGGFWHDMDMLRDWVSEAFNGKFGVIGRIPFTRIEIVLFRREAGEGDTHDT